MAGIFDADFLRGFAFGQSYRPALLRAVDKEIVAYLYGPNKVRLPRLPDYNTEKFPHAYILATESSIWLFVSSLPAEYGTISALDVDTGDIVTHTMVYLYAPDSVIGTVEAYFYLWGTWMRVGSESFNDDSDGRGMYYRMVDSTVVGWANTDIINVNDNSVYHYATEPEPVYE